jgi:serine/threonine protein kinase
MFSMPGTPDPALLEQLRAALDSTYEIERELTGGMARVFVATERALGRRVVIKVLPPQLTAGVNRERFRREIQFAARLQHPHIVPLLTAGQVGEILYYTMPLVEGETLRGRLEREGRLGAAGVVNILQDIVDALAYAHSQGLVHRDIKPENILLQRHHALVTDFGVAKAISEALPGSGATTAGIAVGTPAYMAPEQLAADPAADHRVDIYAIGLLAYELLSGASPFTGSSPQQTLARQLTERPAPPHLHRTDVPAALSALIMRCLEKDPAARWSSAEELLQALAAVKITSSGMPAIARTERIAVQRSGWRRGLVIGAAAALAVVVALGAYSRWGQSRAVSPQPDSISIAATDSTDSVKSAGQTPPAPVPVAPPSVLTRADSEAIAASVARRMMAQREAAPSLGMSQRALDSIRNVVVQSVADSVMRMIGPGRRPGSFGPDVGEISRIAELGREFTHEIEGGRRRYRVAVPPVVVEGPDQELRPVGVAIIDYLASGAERGGSVEIVKGAAGRAITRRMEAGLESGADAAVIGVLRPVAGDSVEIVFELRDGHNPRWAKSLRHAVHRSEIGMLPTVSAPMVMSWIQNRVQESRSARTIKGVSRQQLDSMTRAALRMRDALRKQSLGRPDSPPPPPVPPAS